MTRFTTNRFLLLSVLALVIGNNVETANAACVSCTNCATCLLMAPYSNNLVQVSLSFAGCKSSSSISWACCLASNNNNLPGSDPGECDIHSCDAPTSQWEVSKNKCNELTTASFLVPVNTTSITIQLHDGQFIGNRICSQSNPCCGGSGGACAESGVCETVVDLSTCSTPPPQCSRDSDCTPSGRTCERRVCMGGTCVSENLPSGVVCRPAADLCDVPETCTGFNPDCPADLRKDNGYTFKCGTDQFVCAIPSNELVQTNAGMGAFWINPTGQSGTGTCNVGTAWTITELSWPNCASSCIQRICPNNKQISNYALTHCDINTGKWVCDSKIDVTYSVLLGLPTCPYSP